MANGSAPLDEFQRSALDECAPPCRVSVLGAPGTGKTRLLEALVAREAAAPGGRIAVITFDRRAAGALYDSMSLRLGSLSAPRRTPFSPRSWGTRTPRSNSPSSSPTTCGPRRGSGPRSAT